MQKTQYLPGFWAMGQIVLSCVKWLVSVIKGKDLALSPYLVRWTVRITSVRVKRGSSEILNAKWQ